MTYKIIIHTDYSNQLATNIINLTKHYYYDSVTLRDVYETNDGMAIIFSASSPNEVINGVINSTPAKFEVIHLGFVDGLKVRFGTYVPKDRRNVSAEPTTYIPKDKKQNGGVNLGKND